MKKYIAVLLAMFFVLGMSSVAIAAPAEKTVEVDLAITSEQEFEVIYVGDEVELTAITPKHGSSFVDEWVVLDEDGDLLETDAAGVVKKGETTKAVVDEVTSYVSVATFSALEAGTYTVKYTITMRAGKSDVYFVGEADSDPIEVVEEEDEATITGIEIRDITQDVSKNAKGEIQNIQVRGTVYEVFSDGSKVATTQSVTVTFNKKDIEGGVTTKEVKATIDDIEYTTTVSRT